MPETALPATDFDLISFLKAIPDARMRLRIRIPAWCQGLIVATPVGVHCHRLRVTTLTHLPRRVTFCGSPPAKRLGSFNRPKGQLGLWQVGLRSQSR